MCNVYYYHYTIYIYILWRENDYMNNKESFEN